VEQLAFRNTGIVFINPFDAATEEEENTASVFGSIPKMEAECSSETSTTILHSVRTRISQTISAFLVRNT
jgi:hypothetical protein